MKLLFAECCSNLVVPHPVAYRVSWCQCRQAACWWENPDAGKLVVYTMLGKEYVSVIGIHNGFLTHQFPGHQDPQLGYREYGCIQGDTIKKLIDETPTSYLFKQLNSLIIKVRPGFSKDVRMAELDELRSVEKSGQAPETPLA